MINGDYIFPEEINDILSRYYDGFTSLKEERLLRKYFQEHQIPETFLTDQAILSFPRPEEISFYPTNVIWDKIKQSDLRHKRYKTIRLASSIAASLILLISIGTWYYLSSDKNKTLVADTYTNPEEAYKVVQKYLGLASSKLSYAYTEIKPIEKLSIPSKAIQPFANIDKNLMRLNQFYRLTETTKEMEHLSIITDIMEIDKN